MIIQKFLFITFCSPPLEYSQQGDSDKELHCDTRSFIKTPTYPELLVQLAYLVPNSTPIVCGQSAITEINSIY